MYDPGVMCPTFNYIKVYVSVERYSCTLIFHAQRRLVPLRTVMAHACDPLYAWPRQIEKNRIRFQLLSMPEELSMQVTAPLSNTQASLSILPFLLSLYSLRTYGCDLTFWRDTYMG